MLSVNTERFARWISSGVAAYVGACLVILSALSWKLGSPMPLVVGIGVCVVVCILWIVAAMLILAPATVIGRLLKRSARPKH